MTAKQPPQKVKCPHCDAELTAKGLPGHIAFKHTGAAASVIKAQTPSAPSAAAPAAVKPGAGDDDGGIFKGW